MEEDEASSTSTSGVYGLWRSLVTDHDVNGRINRTPKQDANGANRVTFIMRPILQAAREEAYGNTMKIRLEDILMEKRQQSRQTTIARKEQLKKKKKPIYLIQTMTPPHQKSPIHIHHNRPLTGDCTPSPPQSSWINMVMELQSVCAAMRAESCDSSSAAGTGGYLVEQTELVVMSIVEAEEIILVREGEA